MKRLCTRAVLPFTSASHVPSWCWVDAFRLIKMECVVFTQDRGHVGPSLVNNIERVVAAYSNLWILCGWPEPVNLIWIQHSAGINPTWAMVQLNGPPRDPTWHPVPEELQWLLAGALGELEDRYTVVT